MKRPLSSISPFFLVAVVGIATACTVTTANDATPGGGASSSGGSSGTNSSGGVDDGGASSSGGETASGKFGTISMSQTSFTAGQTTVDSYSLFASFAVATPTAGGSGTGSSCTTSTDGACTVMDCTIASSGDAGTPAKTGDAGSGSAKPPNAGDIAVKATLDVTLSPDGATGVYPTKTGQVKLFAAGEQIAIDAKGGDVPAFSTTLTAPSLVTVTAPTWPAPGQPLQIDRSKALDLKWNDGKSGNVLVSVTSSSASKVGMVSCTFKATDGAGTVPASALGKLAAAGSATISVSGSSTDVVKAGDYTVNVSATSPAKAGTSLASGQAKLQ